MSQENIDIVRRAVQALTRRDVEAFVSYTDPALEFQSAIIGGAEGNTYRGHEGVRQWIVESDAAFAELRVEPLEFRDAGEHVLMLGHLYARGRESGVEVDSPLAWVSTIRAGKIVSSKGYLNPQEPLEAWPPGK